MNKTRMPQHWLTVILIFLLLAACITYIAAPNDLIADDRGWTGYIDDVLITIFSFILSAVAIFMILPKGVSFWLLFVPTISVVYVLWTFDLIPDFIPFLGWLDDVGVALIGLSSFVKGLKMAHRSLTANPQVNQIEMSNGQWEDVE